MTERHGEPPIELFNFDDGFRPYLTVPINAWPEELDFMRFRDLLHWFREAARVEWAADEAVRELQTERAARLDERPEQARGD